MCFFETASALTGAFVDGKWECAIKQDCNHGFTSSFAIESGLPKKLNVSSPSSGTLSLFQNGLEDEVLYEITKGETIVCVEGFNDGIIAITFSLMNAVAGDKFCVQYD